MDSVSASRDCDIHPVVDYDFNAQGSRHFHRSNSSLVELAWRRQLFTQLYEGCAASRQHFNLLGV